MAEGVGKAALGGAAKGAVIGSMIPIPGIGTAVGAGVGALIGAFSGGSKKKKENEAATQAATEADQQQKITDAVNANKASAQANQGGNDIASQASMNPAYGSPVFNPQQSNTIQSVFDPNQKTSVV